MDNKENKNNIAIKISVVVPVYNTEKYLKRCLNSLINQTFKDIEIICVDDGSTDNSMEILNEYAAKDSRIKIITQSNAGVSVARNNGIKIATGDYISFIDADDSVDLKFLDKLYNAATTNNSDIAVAPIIRKKKSTERFRVNYSGEKIYTSLQDKLDICKIPDCSYVWNKLYKAELVKQFKFKEGMYFEDVQWLPEVIKHANSVVTVDQTYYTYYKNPNSIVVRCPSYKKQDDCYNAKKYIVEFYEENNLKLSEKEKNISKRVKFFCGIPLYKIKEYNGIDTVYLFSFLPVAKMPSQKTFLVFNTACFGDVLVCNSLVQNIKLTYPNSKIVFVCNKPFYEVAKYQKNVDDVVVFDKRGEHKGFKGIWNFIKSFPYKKPYASFITYSNIKNYIIAHFLGIRHVIQGGYSFIKSELSSQEQHTNLLKKITQNGLKNLPIEYIATDDIPESLKDIINKNEKYVGFCPLTKNPPKDIPLETAIDVIKEFNNANKYNVILFGVGKEYENYAKCLTDAGCDFVNLVNKTSIYELAQVLKNCKTLISADTGTMHLGYALKTPTLAVFYEKNTLANWAPNPKLYNAITLASNQTPENIYKTALYLLGEEKKNKDNVVIPTLSKEEDSLSLSGSSYE